MFCLIKRRIIPVKVGLIFQEITLITEFPGSNFLLPTFLKGGKWDFQVANLLPATVNFEPCSLDLCDDLIVAVSLTVKILAVIILVLTKIEDTKTGYSDKQIMIQR